jgi:hypothetical protein
VAENKKCE